jgi:uncharacterized repeat protein (TIGR04076 family)
MKVTVTAKDVAKCVSFKPGEKFVVEKNEVLLGESDKVCSYALSSFLPIITAVLKGASFADFGVGDDHVGVLRCMDACGGVVFELRKAE